MGRTISLTAARARTTMIAATTNPTKLQAKTPRRGTHANGGGASAVAGCSVMSDPLYGAEPTGPDGVDEGLVVTFVLVRVALGEVGDRLVERV